MDTYHLFVDADFSKAEFTDLYQGAVVARGYLATEVVEASSIGRIWSPISVLVEFDMTGMILDFHSPTGCSGRGAINGRKIEVTDSFRSSFSALFEALCLEEHARFESTSDSFVCVYNDAMLSESVAPGEFEAFYRDAFTRVVPKRGISFLRFSEGRETAYGLWHARSKQFCRFAELFVYRKFSLLARNCGGGRWMPRTHDERHCSSFLDIAGA